MNRPGWWKKFLCKKHVLLKSERFVVGSWVKKVALSNLLNLHLLAFYVAISTALRPQDKICGHLRQVDAGSCPGLLVRRCTGACNERCLRPPLIFLHAFLSVAVPQTTCKQGTELVAAGFPCIDISRAGLRRGVEGEVMHHAQEILSCLSCTARRLPRPMQQT